MSQPAIFVTSVAILEVVRTNPATSYISPDVTAGLSLGEYTALYAAGVIGFEDALLLVKKRGEAMQAAADAAGGSMVGIIGLDETTVRQLCAQAGDGELLLPVNFNCPGQTVVSGTKAACLRAEQFAAKYGAMKTVRLDVAGAFHTELMSSAADALGEALSCCRISDPAGISTIASTNAQNYSSAEEVAQGLVQQLTSPILWQKCMERLVADGVKKFYEVGPGRVLTGLMRRIERKARIINVSSLDSLMELVSAGS
jgi:[acyl-carrier-protein] S-malonyltransferase